MVIGSFIALNIVLKATNRRFNCLHQKAPKLPFCCCWARLPPKRYLNRIKSLILSLVRLNYHHFVFESRKNFNRKYIFSFLLHLRWKRNTKCSLLLMHLTPCYFLTFPEAILRSAENAALISAGDKRTGPEVLPDTHWGCESVP